MNIVKWYECNSFHNVRMQNAHKMALWENENVRLKQTEKEKDKGLTNMRDGCPNSKLSHGHTLLITISPY